ncbi:MAG: hypothetical protein JRD89_15855 [Deltaproteobacteria bacterium]|nr:hypothetical protein [Deltaproteobacteria bacterium]
MSEERIDIEVVVERIVEKVNQKLAIFDRRITALENQVKKLAMDVESVRGHVIEHVVRSVLSVKHDELASTITARLGAELSEMLGALNTLVESMKSAVDELRSAASELRDLKKLPEKVAEAIGSASPSVEIDASKIEAAVSVALSRAAKMVEDLVSKVANLERRYEELGQSLAKVSEALAAVSSISSGIEELRKSLEELEEDVEEIKHRLPPSGAEEGEEEEEEE